MLYEVITLLAVPLLFALAVIPLKNNTSHIQKSDMSTIREMMAPTQTPMAEEAIVPEEMEAEETSVEEAPVEAKAQEAPSYNFV